jgi:hypothetical protein
MTHVLAIHFRPEPGADGPSWLTLIAHAKDSVWSIIIRTRIRYSAGLINKQKKLKM